MTTWTAQLAHGLAVHLAAHGAGTYRPTGAYAPDETGLVVGPPPHSPDRVVALTLYPLASSPDADTVVGLQVRVRAATGDPREAYELADLVADALDGLTAADLAGCHVHRIRRIGGGPFGLDAKGNAEAVSLFQVSAHHPTWHCR